MQRCAIAVVVCTLIARAAFADLSAALVKDMRPGTYAGFGEGLFAPSFTEMNGRLFFLAEDGIHGYELWKTDGTGAGTAMVADLTPGGPGSFIQARNVLNGSLLFAIKRSGLGYEMWKSDGSEAGTVLLTSQTFSYVADDRRSFARVGDTLYFVARQTGYGIELWKTDGTEAGTAMLDINPSPYDSLSNSHPGGLLVFGGALFFTATSQQNGSFELWKTDGTAAGTVRVKDTWPGFSGTPRAGLADVNGTLFFAASDPVHGTELWKTDETADGTVFVADVYAGSQGSNFYFPNNLNGTFLFVATDYFNSYVGGNPGHGYELWRSDGTAEGTMMVKDINPAGSYSSAGYAGFDAAPLHFTLVEDTMFFTADDGVHGRELWKTDGTTAGTVMVKDVWPGPNGLSTPDGPDPITIELKRYGSLVLFAASDGVSGRELWVSDGTEEGTVPLADLVPSGSSSPVGFAELGPQLVFSAITPETGRELFALPEPGAIFALACGAALLAALRARRQR
jgi:ELWxxDGT repeat protein